jgi:NFACT protein C-terminal domain
VKNVNDFFEIRFSLSRYVSMFFMIFSFPRSIGIIRTIRKHGYENMETSIDPTDALKRKSEKNPNVSKGEKKLDEDGLDDSEGDEDVVDDTAELSKLTGKPHPEDLLLFAVPVCAPYQSLSQYTYRVKLTPGNMKRGKSSKQCLDILLKTPNNVTAGMEKHFELMKKVADNDWVQAICADVKISAPGASKAVKQQKLKNKKSK